MHDRREFARDSDSGSLETRPLLGAIEMRGDAPLNAP